MSDNVWYMLAILCVVVILGLKVAAIVLMLAALYWFFTTKD